MGTYPTISSLGRTLQQRPAGPQRDTAAQQRGNPIAAEKLSPKHGRHQTANGDPDSNTTKPIIDARDISTA